MSSRTSFSGRKNAIELPPRLIVELVRAKEFDGAREVAKNLPRAEGYVNKLINSLPQIIFEGGADLALELYDEFVLANGSQRQVH